MAKSGNWRTLEESPHQHERDALAFVRRSFPKDEPYRAWTNFEFIADDGSVNEVDLLAFTPRGLFLIEIKSHPGRITGDAGELIWQHDGRTTYLDHPLYLANKKAKRLKSLLEKHARQRRGEIPFVQPLIFFSAEGLDLQLRGNGGVKVCRRDPLDPLGNPVFPLVKPGVLAALMQGDFEGNDLNTRVHLSAGALRVVAQAMEEAGVREPHRRRVVSDYRLERLVDEGPGYQDWHAVHVQVPDSVRRVRIYLARQGATHEERLTLKRAAIREFQLLENLAHPGILRVQNCHEHDLGSAVIFEHDPKAIRLDHFLSRRGPTLDLTQRIDLVRQLAEALRFAHEKKVFHRALSPRSVLVSAADTDRPRLKIFNWQLGSRGLGGGESSSRDISATAHADYLLDEQAGVYLAPEARSIDPLEPQLDLFSLGAIAYLIFSGQPPATDSLELGQKLREHKGLSIASVVNGASNDLQYLIRWATHPEVGDRMGSVAEFLEALDEVQRNATPPDPDAVDDPTTATAGQLLPGGYRVIRRLGQGSCSVAFLAEHSGQDFILKVASSAEHDERVVDEGRILAKLHQHQHIVKYLNVIDLGGRKTLVLEPVYVDRDKRTIETLGQRLRREGRLQLELLQRFGEDLLGVVLHLDEQGIPHRDIKPDNIAVGMVGRGSRLHLVLFDFSLSRTSHDQIRAGTAGYLDPLLPLRKKPRWDAHAEYYAAAITLHELATGTLPKWGDGRTDPSLLPGDVEITLDAEQFEPALREPLMAFFRRALRRDVSQRFANAEEMLRGWQEVFRHLDATRPLTDHDADEQLDARLARATLDTQIPELGLSTRATNVLDRANLLTVRDWLLYPVGRLVQMRGVGSKTRSELTSALRMLRERLGTPDSSDTTSTGVVPSAGDAIEPGQATIEQLLERILPPVRPKRGRPPKDAAGSRARQALVAYLGLAPDLASPWPSQVQAAAAAEVAQPSLSLKLEEESRRWHDDQELLVLGERFAEQLAGQGGVLTLAEASEALIVARGSTADEPLRSRQASAVLRALTELEQRFPVADEPRWIVRRHGERILLARSSEAATEAIRLGDEADRLAAEDPLVPPHRVVERLRERIAPEHLPIGDVRLIRLAAALSKQAAVSSRQELYPIGMPAPRAIKLSQGALYGPRQLTIDELRDRVAGRYPQAERLPDRPLLDELLREAGLDHRWDPTAVGGRGAYVLPSVEAPLVSSGTGSGLSELDLRAPQQTTDDPSVLTTEEVDLRRFEEKLNRAAREGAMLALLIEPRRHARALAKLTERFGLLPLDLEGLFLDAMHQVAAQGGIDWKKVVETDERPQAGDWDRLKILVGRAIPKIRQSILDAAASGSTRRPPATLLAYHAGLLARYDRMPLLSELHQQLGRPGGLHGLWLLVPGEQATIDGHPIPLLSPAQKVSIPPRWLND